MIVTILIFILILSVLVLIHEAGHFFVAKKLKIRVEEFGFGLPPRAFGIKRGETVYSINWLPIGGFVRLYGEDEAGAGRAKLIQSDPSIPLTGKLKVKEESRAFYARPVWQRFVVVVAGVVMNFILAVLIISYLFSAVGVPTPGNEVVVAQVTKNSPAQKAGLKENDIVLSINNQKITQPEQLINITKKHLGEKVTLKIKDTKSKIRDIEVVPRKEFPKTEGPIGVTISQNVEIIKYPWYKAPVVGTVEALKDSWLIISGLGILVYQLLTLGTVPQGVAGPVGIAELTGQFVQIGPYAVLSFVSLLSLNLAILNILPIPALDGGRLLFIVIEAVTGRKINRKFEGYAHAAGMALLLTLILLITLHDIYRLITGQPILPKIQ